VADLSAELLAVDTRAKEIITTLSAYVDDDDADLRSTQEQSDFLREHLVSICLDTGATSFTIDGNLMFNKVTMGRLRRDDGLRGIHGLPAPMILTQGFGPDWQLHVLLLRAFLGKDFVIWGLELPIALEAMYSLYPSVKQVDGWEPAETHIRACVEAVAKKATVYVGADSIGSLGYKVKQSNGHAAREFMRAEFSIAKCFPAALQQVIVLKETAWRALTHTALSYDPTVPLSKTCDEVIDDVYEPALATIRWANSLVKIPTQNGIYIQSLRSTSMHFLIDDHLVKEVRASQHCNLVRGATGFEDKHKEVRVSAAAAQPPLLLLPGQPPPLPSHCHHCPAAAAWPLVVTADAGADAREKYSNEGPVQAEAGTIPLPRCHRRRRDSCPPAQWGKGCPPQPASADAREG
jgi:hypothetical protein